ncbi:MAG: hypothetical protein A4S09_14315 [Proteobacteria bacterium SG_bin7]|nr:MAG: hypothetical protein A4S09_14315 [Proteobacteria bacterium SG_bin7]
MKFSSFLLLGLLVGSSGYAAELCFTMTPQKALEKKCDPVSVSVVGKECSTGKIKENWNATAKYICNGKERKLVVSSRQRDIVAEVNTQESWGSEAYTVGKTQIVLKQGAPPKKAPAPKVAVAPVSAPVTVSPAVAAPTPVEPVSKPAEVAPPVSPVPASKLKFSGLFDFYYAYNLNNPNPTTSTTTARAGDQNTFNTFNYYHDQFALSLAKITVQQATEPFGFRIDLAAGPTAAGVAGSLTDFYNSSFMQAYLSWKLPSGLLIEAGKFATHLGYELIEASDNANYSRSLIFTYGPFWHTGLRASYAWSDKLTTNFYIYNGWNNYYETNRNKALGFQVAYIPRENYQVIVNYIGSREPTTINSVTDDDSRGLWDVIVSGQITPSLKLAMNYDWASELFNGTTRGLKALALYGTWQFQENRSASLRYETFDDSEAIGFGTGTAQKITSVTATLEHKAGDQLKIRAEYRMDSSDKNSFAKINENGSTTQVGTQDLGMVALLLSF